MRIDVSNPFFLGITKNNLKQKRKDEINNLIRSDDKGAILLRITILKFKLLTL